MSEAAIYEQLARILQTSASAAGGAVPFGDDMAAIPGHDQLLWTTDMLLDGVHFDAAVHDWFLIGRKAMAVNLSDCAAMGARPVAAVCAVSANVAMTNAQFVRLHEGAHVLGLQFDCPLTGGDTNRWQKPTVVAITVVAEVGESGPVRRDQARVGDSLWVSGKLGGSIRGRHLTFTPRVKLGREIAARLRPNAMMDISDGLSLDLSRMVAAAGVGAVLDSASLAAVIHDDARTLSERDGVSPLDHALHDGEDFELLIALPADVDATLCADLGLSRIGETTAAETGVCICDGETTTPLAIRGWDHFK